MFVATSEKLEVRMPLLALWGHDQGAEALRLVLGPQGIRLYDHANMFTEAEGVHQREKRQA